ncbi:MAG: hypothetical protein IIC67_03055 [Thaumarchaeota archaeon]|nr:hypothetical protein [Nitrososphaerota archaeon]
MGIWQKLSFWDKEDKGYKFETSKKGENYFSVLKVNDEVVMSIISPPTSFNTDTSVGIEGKASAAEVSASGGVNVSRDKAVTYGKPIVLFNKNNSAGLEMKDMLAEVKTQIEKEDPTHEKFGIDLDKLNENDADIVEEKSVTIGSTIVDMQEKEVVLRPNFKIPLKLKDTLELCLEYMIKSMKFSDGYFRANIMLFNPISKKLKIVANYQMIGYKDENLEIGFDQGGAGYAFTKNKVEVVDLYMKKHSDYNIDSDTIWEQMKSIVSVPITDEDKNSIGVLNIDTDMLYQTAGFHTTDFQNGLRMQSQIIAKILEGYEFHFS